MLRPRIIPALLIHDNGLNKTVKFKPSKYVGDPLNAVKIFNELHCDEIVILDIDASIKSKEPNYDLIKKIAAECRMPLCYGGGIKNAYQAEKILSLGVEKVSLSSILYDDPELVNTLAKSVGNQSIVACIDVKKSRFLNKYECYTHNGKIKQKIDLLKFINDIQMRGIGEIVINSIDNDGVMNGYDLNLFKKVSKNSKVPVTMLGGAGNLEDIQKLVNVNPIVGAAAGSIFVFKGKYKAVLINYPNESEKLQIGS